MSTSHDDTKKMFKSRFIHVLIGGIALSFIFTMQAKLTNIPIIPQRYIVPFFVGILFGYFVWKSKNSLIIKNEELRLEVEKRTMELKIANDNLLVEIEKTKKINSHLERVNGLMIGRELKMKELKNQIKSSKI